MKWLKRNTNDSIIADKNLTSTHLVYRDNKGYIGGISLDRKLGDDPVLVGKSIAICETLMTTSDCNMDKLLIESNS